MLRHIFPAAKGDRRSPLPLAGTRAGGSPNIARQVPTRKKRDKPINFGNIDLFTAFHDASKGYNNCRGDPGWAVQSGGITDSCRRYNFHYPNNKSYTPLSYNSVAALQLEAFTEGRLGDAEQTGGDGLVVVGAAHRLAHQLLHRFAEGGDFLASAENVVLLGG